MSEIKRERESVCVRVCVCVCVCVCACERVFFSPSDDGNRASKENKLFEWFVFSNVFFEQSPRQKLVAANPRLQTKKIKRFNCFSFKGRNL